MIHGGKRGFDFATPWDPREVRSQRLVLGLERKWPLDGN
jgi:hypothetical protein